MVPSYVRYGAAFVAGAIVMLALLYIVQAVISTDKNPLNEAPATFVKQPGLDVTRPDERSAESKPLVSVLIAIGESGDVWIDKKRVELDNVHAQIERLHAENPKGGMVVQVDRRAKLKVVRSVLEAARGAKVLDVALVTEE